MRWLRHTVISLWLAAALPARAEPLVRVRAESRIELGVTHQDLGIVISGALRDELGTPLTGRTLALEAFALQESGEPWRTQVATDDQGRFSLELADSAQDYRLLATFVGDTTHRGVRVERRIERARADVRLELRLPQGNVLDLDGEKLDIEAVAESDAGGADIAMRLSDERDRTLARGNTDPEGRLLLRVPADAFGAPGTGLLRLESARDERRAEAQTEARVVRRRAVFIELLPGSERFEAGGLVRVRGMVRTSMAPRARVPVGLFARGRHLATVITDERGSFEAELWIDAPPGPLPIRARTEADATGAYPAAESRLTLEISEARPVPVFWMLLALALVVLALWLASRVRRHQRAAEHDGLDIQIHRESLGSSVRPARAHGRRDRQRVEGRAIDARSGAPVVQARVRVAHERPEGCCALSADAQGHFSSPVLPAGRARLIIEARGYVSTHADLEIPHRGEWSAFVVKLESLRDRALSPFRRIVLRVLPSARAWGIWTNREAREWLIQRTSAQQHAVQQLTLDVERACYAEVAPTEADVARIEEAAQRIETQLTREKNTEFRAEPRTPR